METLFGLGAMLAASFLFWPALALLVVLLWVSTENDKGWWSTLVTLLLGFVVYTKWPQLKETFGAWTFVVVVGGYLVAGILWSFAKWYLVNRKVYSKLVGERNAYTTLKGLPSDYFSPEKIAQASQVHLDDFGSRLEQVFNQSAKTLPGLVQKIIPQASENKASIVLWMMYWPLSVLWYLLADVLSNFAEWVYDHFGGLFQRVSDRMFKQAL